MMARLRQVAREEGLPLGKRTKTYNSRLAQELGKWAEKERKGPEFHHAVFRAYFADGKNIARISVLVDVAVSVNLPGYKAQEVLETRAFKEMVDRDWSRSFEMGVRAVPTFRIDGHVLVGAQPYEILERLMKECGVKKRS
jgi:predicted DsbA family dithiol-disulfide isomerase